MHTAIQLEHSCDYAPEHGCNGCKELDTCAQGQDEGADMFRTSGKSRLARNLENGATVFVAVAAMVAFVWSAM